METIFYDDKEYFVKNTSKEYKGHKYLQASNLECPLCPSSDAFTVYANDEEGDELHGFCYSHNSFVEMIDVEEQEEELSKPNKTALTREELEQQAAKIKSVLKILPDKPFKERRLSAEANKRYGIRTDQQGNRYYAVTDGGKLSSLKVRYPGKSFTFIYNGAKTDIVNSEMFGQCRFNKGGKYLIITGGEEDAPAYWQAMKGYYTDLNKNYEVAVISPMTGESSAHTQIKNNFEYVNSFDNIYICMDNDKAGKQAAERIKEVLPDYKTFVIKLDLKDPCDYLKANRSKDLVTAFWNAESVSGLSFVKPDSLYDMIIEESGREKVSFPDFAKGLQKKSAGGFTLGGYGVLIAPTGVGKTTLTATFVDHFIRNTPYKTCVISGEMTPAEYATSLFSTVLGHRIENIESTEERLAYLKQPEVAKHIKEYNEKYQDKYVILQNGEESFNSKRIKTACEVAVKRHDSKVIILDPIQFLVGTDTEEVAVFARWLKAFSSANGVFVWVVSHIRKSVAGTKSNSTGKDIGEDDAKGVGALIENSSHNMIVTRNKEAEDEDERNTLKVLITKLRFGGTTGPAPDWRYIPETHRIVEV